MSPYERHRGFRKGAGNFPHGIRSAAQYLYASLSIHETAARRRSLHALLNTAPLFGTRLCRQFRLAHSSSLAEFLIKVAYTTSTGFWVWRNETSLFFQEASARKLEKQHSGSARRPVPSSIARGGV
jgi:hypothetical protein